MLDRDEDAFGRALEDHLAGRHALHLQDLGYEVTDVDASPGAVAVCRARGVRDVRLDDLTVPPADVAPLVQGTDRALEQHVLDGADHYVVLRRA